MGASQEGYINNGDIRPAAQYSRNLVAASSVYARIAELYQDLLAAERNNNVEMFGQLESWIAPIIKDAKAVDQAPMRPEGLPRYMRKRSNRLKLLQGKRSLRRLPCRNICRLAR